MADMMRNMRGNSRMPISGEARMQSVSCQNLKKKLQMVDFAIIDTVLYLNAYPKCAQALEYYHKLVKEREILEGAMKEKCGPITAMTNQSRSEWTWPLGPWPWEPEAN